MADNKQQKQLKKINNFQQKFEKTRQIEMLYEKYYHQAKKILLKKYFRTWYSKLIEMDDLDQILDYAFVQTIDIDYEHEKTFFRIFVNKAKNTLIDNYRMFGHKRRKEFKSLEWDSINNNILIDEILNYNSELNKDLDEWEISSILDDTKYKIKFLNWYYDSLKNSLTIKKILFYKLQKYSFDDISDILGIEKKLIIKKWHYLTRKIRIKYEYWKKNILDKRDI